MGKIDELIKELCPDGVEYVKLGEIATLSRGKVYSKEYVTENAGVYPLYSSQTRNDGIFGLISSFDYEGEYLTWTTDGAYAGSIFHRKGKFSITNVCGLITIKNKCISYRFLYYWLSIHAKEYVYEGMGNPKLMTNQMIGIQIPLPPLSVQQQIVEILDTFTDSISNLQEELELREKQMGYYRENLLSFDSEEVEWKKIRNIADKCYPGATPSTKKPEYWNNGTIPWMSSGEVHQGRVKFVEKHITQLGYDKTSTKMVPVNSIVVALAGQGKTRGTVAITQIELCTNQSICSIVPNKNFLNPYYLYYFLKGQYLNLRLLSAGDGTRGGLTLKMIEEYKIPVPSLSRQQVIVDILDTFESMIANIKEEIELRQKQYEYYREKLLTFD